MAMIAARELSARCPELRLVFGGPHATLDPESILQYVPNGIVVRGDGEKIFSKIAEGENPAKLNGAVLLDSSGKVIYGGEGIPNVIPDLNTLPWIDRDLLANEPYLKGSLPTMAILTSRGCRGGCGFCITPAQYEVLKMGGAKKVRFRDIKDVVSEVRHLVDSYGLQMAQFIDDDMMPNPSRAKEFLEAWEEAGLKGMEFVCLLRPDLIGRFHESGLLQRLHDAGLKKISMGIETGSDWGRALVSGGKDNGWIDPKYRRENVVSAVKACGEVGIDLKLFAMLGLPGESREQMGQTLTYLHELRNIYGEAGNPANLRAAVFPFKAYPGTSLYDAAIKLGHTPEELGSYDTPDIHALIARGIKTVDATRDGFTNTAQLALDVVPEEVNDMCHEFMLQFNGSEKAE
jgi:radical SAM superfamily enzyme YgiQ (UPF0313 family)